MVTNLQQMIADVLNTNKDMRVVAFEFENEKYWLKQAEHTTGFMRILKANPKRALQQEIQALQYLNKLGAPCAELVAWHDDYFVLKDAGITANQWLKNPQFTPAKKQEVLEDCAAALAQLHTLDLVHGRPAIRDIGWNNGKVRFIDFESKLNVDRLQWNKARDLIIFVHDLYRNTIPQAMIESAVGKYRTCGGEATWQYALAILYKRRFLYTLFKPFYPIAGKDLLASLKLFEYLLQEAKK
ncbi:Aminoglycoside phosphotransferase [Pasteurella testudinis DSM 23072]|uniref:Aminoglycoside phosphotransferase n=1 Tax=Pasteurella testudinis DSM 23072 TaxID=1122938 RepID=A0A1W1UDL0_9PAST|nr:phosphotransferase [Pasteurella testudinis]SMB79112.1 Aminoglycoside phosphotransferase [Pasteurella testudinis DSM 23072]SUB52404.1 protein kinase-like domain protein [Pasteurella testudinis]